MDKKLFNKLIKSVKPGGRIKKEMTMRKRNRHRNRANELGEDQFKIVSEKYVPYVDMDIEMGDKLREELLFYARQNILNDEDTLLNWAFVKALEKGIKHFEQNEEPK